MFPNIFALPKKWLHILKPVLKKQMVTQHLLQKRSVTLLVQKVCLK